MPIVHAGDREYLTGFQRLLPQGRIWHRGWDMVQDADLLTLMPTWARLHTRLSDLIAEIFPCTTTDLLTEWEASLGLPDECTGQLATIAARRQAVCAKFAMRGGQSAEYFTQLCARYDIAIRVQPYSAFYADNSRADTPCGEEEWNYVWGVWTPPVTVYPFLADHSTAEDPLQWWSDTVLPCLLVKYKPAHTLALILYTMDRNEWDQGLTRWDGGLTVWDQKVIEDEP